jgi:excisionase family DNA binding protein
MIGNNVPILTKEVARILDLTGERVRQLEKAGILTARRTSGGVRLFDRAEVERFARERSAR